MEKGEYKPPTVTEKKKDCDTCLNRCMDMDMDPYCAAVNQPWGKVLTRGKPEECGKESKLWTLDTRRFRKTPETSDENS